ncbi:hypothetical protein TA3x_000998 [Tundrisphaera sp. TA3]|uniref:hypothetical protein n=1 Tax=Tundrisphaera sp. TA3 TaxID=3435775 RepID=UPI003EBAE4F9
MTPRREFYAFMIALAAIVVGFFHESLLLGRVLSPADVLFASASFREIKGPGYEPANRLLMDPVLQFQPWIEFNRELVRSERLPLWNDRAGCGAPHLANGQAAVFDPFQLFAYLGSLPEAYGRMAAARLWFAGLGMFLLARAWGLGAWGRWFAGLTFPFCGFLVGWLLYPVTNAAIWLPWCLLATDGAWDRPSWRSAGRIALATGGTLLGGHVQTAAHVLLAMGVYAAWRAFRPGGSWRPARWWVVGVALGIGIAAVEIVPLGAYLARSPVWGDRDRERVPAWALARPRPLDALRTALPYLYGSHRRGQPNLAKAVGVHNLNETAGGFAGLATLIWLAPLAWSARRDNPRVRFLAGLTLFGLLAAFQFPPADNLLRALPVLKVTDNRRLTLWVAFGLALLGGIGLDRLSEVRRGGLWRKAAIAWLAASAVLLCAALAIGGFAPTIRARAEAHYLRAAEETPGADPAAYRAMARLRADETLRFVPVYLGLAAAQGITLTVLMAALRRRSISDDAGRAILLGITVVDLFGFGFGLNPAIDPADDRPVPPVIADLQRTVGRSGRIIGVGAELPPNVLMRYGLADARNYDSVEMARSLDWLAPLYPPGPTARTSRRTITWARVAGARDRLREAGVVAAVGADEPPPGLFARVDRVGSTWVARLDAEPLVGTIGDATLGEVAGGDGRWRIAVDVGEAGPARVVVRQTFDPGWRAELDGEPALVEAHRGAFLAIEAPPGKHAILLTYEPVEVKIGVIFSALSLAMGVFALTRSGPFRSSGIVVQPLGRTQASGLESDSPHIPDDPTGERNEG